MENAVIYLVKASALTAVFYLAYYLFLRKETFFTGNRWFLLAGLFTSFLLPLINYTHIVWTDPVPVIQDAKISINITTSTVAPIEEPVNWLLIALVLYSTGVVFFLARFTADIFILYKTLKKYTPVKTNGFKIIDNAAITSPFSFFRYIAYSSGNLTADDLTDIINHEKVHSRELHSLDMVLVQLCAAVIWFNPFIWLYKKAVYQNLEFIADAKSTATIADKTTYQKTLLKITMQPECMALTNHFYQSLIKKRIIMLNKNQSPRRHVFKYTLILPALCAFIYLFQVQTVAQQKAMPDKVVLGPYNNKTVPTDKLSPGTLAHSESLTIEITKDDSGPQLTAKSGVLKQQYNVDIRFSNVIRNTAGEITSINVDQYKDGEKSAFEMKVDQKGAPIKSFTIVATRNNGGETDLTIGGTADKTISATTPDGKPVEIKGNEFRYKINDQPLGSGTVISDRNENTGGGNMHTITTTTFSTYKKDASTMKESLKTIEAYLDNVQILINGKEATVSEFKKLDANNIAEFVVSKETDKNIQKYGQKAKNGVLMVNTKDSGLQTIIEKPKNTDALFYIHKTDSNKDVNQIVKLLAEKGITMKYSKLERNRQNQIISIVITVEDNIAQSSGSAVWAAKQNENGIPDIVVGRRNDKAIVASNQ